MKLRIVFLLLAIITTYSAGAQSFYNFGRSRTLAVSAGFGNASYFGDLKDPRKYLDPQYNLTAGLQYFKGPRLGIRADLTYFKLEGNDAESSDAARNVRNLSFKSSNVELAFTGSFSFLETPVRFDRRPVVNGYGFAGLGFLYTNPTADYLGVKYALQPLQTEGQSYSRFNVVVPFGLGARIRAADFINIVIEGGYRITFTDYLDDVSTVHQDKGQWEDPIRVALSDRRPEIGLSPAEPGQIRGDPTDKDGYFLFSVKAEYYLPDNFLAKNSQRKLYNRKRKSYNRRR